MLTIITSIIIIAIAILAIISEILFCKRKRWPIEIFPMGLAIVSSVGASAFSILVENGLIEFNWWQAIGLVIIIAVVGVVWTVIDFAGEYSETIYPWISTIINLIVFAASSIVAWVG